MSVSTEQDYLLTPSRILTQSETRFFFVTHDPVPWSDLDTVLDPLLDELYEAKALASLGETGPDIFRYYRKATGSRSGGPHFWTMEVGIPVKPGVQPAGKAKIKTLAPFRCVGSLLWGSLAHVKALHDTVLAAIEALGATQTYEQREWTYYFEDAGSPRNLMGLYVGIVSQGEPDPADRA